MQSEDKTKIYKIKKTKKQTDNNPLGIREDLVE
mgnify:CR=1 FL=1